MLVNLLATLTQPAIIIDTELDGSHRVKEDKQSYLARLKKLRRMCRAPAALPSVLRAPSYRVLAMGYWMRAVGCGLYNLVIKVGSSYKALWVIYVQSYEFCPHLAQLDNLDFTLCHKDRTL